MRQTLNRCALFAALSMMLMVGTVRADADITSFDNFVSDALYPGWAFPSTTIVSGPTSYSITATGYGAITSTLKILCDGTGYTQLQLTVTLSGPPAADGQLGPIVTLLDIDGTRNNYAFFGQTLGSHVLVADLANPTWTDTPGNPGLNPNELQHMHMQLDPGGFGSSGAYTIVWEDLSLITRVPEPSSIMLLLSSVGLLGLRRR